MHTLLMMLLSATPSWAQDNTTTTWSEWINNNLPEWYYDVLEVFDDEENDQDEFIISTPDQFAAFAKIVNDDNPSCQHGFEGKTVKLGANIDLGTTYYDSDDNEVTCHWDFLIGDDNNQFKGTFDGQGHTIEGLVTPEVTLEDGKYGLFGYIGEGGTVRNVSLGATCQINGNGEYFAGIAYSNEGLVENCACAATLTYTGDGSFSGIVHYNEGTVRGCYYVGPYNENMSHVIISNYNNTGTLENNYYYAATEEDEDNYNHSGNAYDCTRVFAIRLPAGVTVTATDPENVGIMVGRTFYAPDETTVTLNVKVDNKNEYKINYEDINLGSGEENDVFAIYFPNAVDGKDEVENPNPISYTVEDMTNDEIELLDASRPGYEFGGWYEDENCEGERVYSILTGDTGEKTFWAKWLELFTITYNLDGGTNAIGNPDLYNIETPTITLGDPTKRAYTFTAGSTATVTLPFSVDVSKVSGGTFYGLVGIDKHGQTGWEVVMKEVTGILQPHQPYLFRPTATTMTFDLGGQTVTLKANTQF